MPIRNAFLRQIGINRGGTRTNQHRDIMHIKAFRDADIERCEGAEPVLHQMRLHRADRKDHGDHGAFSALRFIRQDHMGAAGPHTFFGFAADAFNVAAQPCLTFRHRKGTIHHTGGCAHIRAHGVKLSIGQYRAVQHQHVALRWVLIKDIPKIAEPGLQRHHPRLTQAVNRRIGHLAESLTEIMMQAAIMLRQHGDRCVIAHGPHSLIGVFHHGVQDRFQFFHGIADGKLAAPQILAGQIGAFIGFGFYNFINARGAFGPLAKGLADRNQILQRRVFKEAPLIQINADGLAGTNAALLDDAVFGKLHHAGLGSHNQQPIRRHAIAQRAQPIAIQARDYPAPISGTNRCRAIPGFHDGVAVQN